jgi:hypothetical protein
MQGAGCVLKETIGIKPEEKVAGPEMWETMCNPIAQILIINHAEVIWLSCWVLVLDTTCY